MGLRRGRTIAAGAASRARRRCTVARDTTQRGTGRGDHSAGRRQGHDRFGQGSPSLDASGMPSNSATCFLDPDDRLGTCQVQRQTGIVVLQQRHFGGERLGLGDLRTTPGWRQRAECSGVALTAPVGQRRRVDAVAAQDGADPTGRSGAIGLGEKAQLVPRGESPAARAIRQFR
jgi:hypothetical protein